MSGGYATSQCTGHARWLSRIRQGSTRFIDKSSCLFSGGEMDQSRAHGHLHEAARVQFSSALFNDTMQSGSHQLSHQNTTLLWSQSSHASWSSLQRNGTCTELQMLGWSGGANRSLQLSCPNATCGFWGERKADAIRKKECGLHNI